MPDDGLLTMTGLTLDFDLLHVIDIEIRTDSKGRFGMSSMQSASGVFGFEVCKIGRLFLVVRV